MKAFWLALSYLPIHEIVRCFRVNKRWYELARQDSAWKDILMGFHLTVILPNPARDLLLWTRTEFLSLSSLFGVYSFAAASTSSFGGNGGGGSSPSTYNVSRISMELRPGRLGQKGPACRCRISITYENWCQEVLDGYFRFSWSRKLFLISTFWGTMKNEGPYFSCLVSIANRAWANESPEAFALHTGGLRLVLTMIELPRRTIRRSMLVASDVLAVTRDPAPTSPVASPEKKKPFLRIINDQR